MARDHLGRPAAFELLRRAARAQRRGLGDVAADLLDAGRLPDEDA
jgi:AmiR/NasT family two-component response regulator